jgi:type IX secretion system substrate protein
MFDLKYNIKVQLLIISVVVLFKVQLYSQCGYSSLISHFPVTINNVTITETDTDGPPYHSSTYTNDTVSNCGVLLNTYMLLGFSPVSDSYAPFTQTITFSSPVNNITYVIGGSDSLVLNDSTTIVESFSFTVNAGTLNCTQQGTCLYTQYNNVFSANSNVNITPGKDNDAYIKLTSTVPYTSITVLGSGGNGGSYMSLCANSISVLGIQSIDKNSFLKTYPNPANTKINIACSLQLAACSLYDVLGNEVISTKEKEIDVSNLSNSVYFLNVKTTAGVLSKKVVIQH